MQIVRYYQRSMQLLNSVYLQYDAIVGRLSSSLIAGVYGLLEYPYFRRAGRLLYGPHVASQRGTHDVLGSFCIPLPAALPVDSGSVTGDRTCPAHADSTFDL